MFDLVTETEVFSAQRALANEMAPQIEECITRAEGGLEELKQRERALQGKVSALRRKVGMDGVPRRGISGRALRPPRILPSLCKRSG